MPRSGSSTTRCGGWGRSTVGRGARAPAARGAGAPGDVGSEGFDFGDFGGLGDIFSSIFGRGGRQAEPQAETVEAVVEVPFRVAALGGKITVTIPVTERLSHLRRATAARLARPGPPVPSATDGARSRSARAALR